MKKNLLNYLQEINPQFDSFNEQEILDDEKKIVGFNVYGMEKDGNVFSGGTSNNIDTARRIAISEAFERSFLDKIKNDNNLRVLFKLDEFPSSSGFAAGFDNEKVKFRAFCEGVERWAWSQWIDYRFFMPKIKINGITNPLSIFLINKFDSFYWYKKDFEINFENKPIILSFVIFIGIKGDGIFPGSRVSTPNDDLFSHPIIEAYRNLNNATLNKFEINHYQDIIGKRIMFFSKNKQIAFDQINDASQINWPNPEIDIFSQYPTEVNDVYLWRCIFKNFIGWHLGDVNRFVY